MRGAQRVLHFAASLSFSKPHTRAGAAGAMRAERIYTPRFSSRPPSEVLDRLSVRHRRAACKRTFPRFGARWPRPALPPEPRILASMAASLARRAAFNEFDIKNVLSPWRFQPGAFALARQLPDLLRD